MSLDQVRSAVETFIGAKQNGFLMLKGGWGVGKTHFWRRTVEEASKSNKIGKDKYAYVSLFGLQSLVELKNSIVTSRVSSDSVGKDANVSASQMFAGLKTLFSGVEEIPALKNYTGGLVSSIAFQSVSDTLVCLDDFERRSDSLPIKDILGLAAVLKEQKNCQIILICNEDSLPEPEVAEFSRHSEKLVDIEIKFAPTPEEAFDYAFDETDKNYDLIREKCLVLGIQNVRVLQRVRRFTNDLLPHLQDIDETLARAIISSMILFVWLNYEKDTKGRVVPTIEYVERFKFNHLLRDIGQRKVTDEEKTWEELLEKFGYQFTDDIDRELISFIRLGYLNVERLTELIKQRQAEISSGTGREAYTKVWDIYYRSSFKENQTEFIGKLIETFRENMQYLTLIDLDIVCGIVTEFDRTDVVPELITKYAEKATFVQEANSFVDDSDPYPKYQIKHSQVAAKIAEVTAKPDEPPPTLAELVDKIVFKSSYSSVHRHELASFAVEDFVTFLRAYDDYSLYSMVKTLIQLGGDGPELAIRTKVFVALKQIAKTSKINEMRVTRYFGLNLDDLPDDYQEEEISMNEAL